MNLGGADVRRTAGFSRLLPDGSLTLPANYRVTGRYKVQGLEVSALASWPVTREFAVTGRAGGLLYHATYEEHGIASHGRTWNWRPGSETGVAPLAGAGVRYSPDPRIAFGVEWVHVHDVGKPMAAIATRRASSRPISTRCSSARAFHSHSLGSIGSRPISSSRYPTSSCLSVR